MTVAHCPLAVLQQGGSADDERLIEVQIMTFRAGAEPGRGFSVGRRGASVLNEGQHWELIGRVRDAGRWEPLQPTHFQ